ncbi:glycosyltransferase family 4 protein [candidate division WOR-3 bacterium]|uniref:Glycosyltransferase family 4 protein n=1 Tax=candidate division WOR-3 bacterium TaxID=2052148 RepID=A0A937XG74_UNCW3|nr:glycosyltransferase family 4 protein [candidate division WOR-3 bacterium]
MAPEFAQILSRSSVLNILPAPSHEELPSYLRGADILLLPESFNPKHANTNRLAVSSKSHLYMMSERPVLVYAPSETGVAEYAKREGWACLVETEGKAPLAGALLKLATDEVLQEKLVARGVEVARQNHDEAVIREKIRRALSSAAFIDDRAGGSAIPPHATERGPTD